MNMKKVMKKIFSRSTPFFMKDNRRYLKYEIGEWTYGKPRIRSWREGTTLKIGRFCSIADGVTVLLGGEHRVDWVTTFPINILFGVERVPGLPHTKGDVVIGHDVWIGQNALILSGVQIGNGAVIAARSVVKESVLPYSIVAGNPAKHVKFRFSKLIIDDLQKIEWWNWPLSKIEEAWPLLLSSDIEAFIARYKT
jgi:acetyltransferase-like isoleucine patch superfamily enzyme